MRIACRLHYVRWDVFRAGRLVGSVAGCNETQALRVAAARFLGVPLAADGPRRGLVVKPAGGN